MEGHVGPILDFIVAHQGWAGPILFALAFGESLAFVGLFFPCTLLMLGTGALVGVGVLDLWPVLTWSIAGAALGDAVSYWAGRHFGMGLLRRPSLRRRGRTVAQGRLFFRRWGVFSIFLGRFLGPLRAIVPLLAGVMRMHHPRFQLVNILSAIVWVPAMLAPGWVLAMSVDEIGAMGEGRWLLMTVLPALLAAALLILGVRLWRRRPRQLRVRAAPAAAPHRTPG